MSLSLSYMWAKKQIPRRQEEINSALLCLFSSKVHTNLNAPCFWWYFNFLPHSHQLQRCVCVCLHLFVWMLIREIERGGGCLCVFANATMRVCNHASSGQGRIEGASLLAVPGSRALFPGLTFGLDIWTQGGKICVCVCVWWGNVSLYCVASRWQVYLLTGRGELSYNCEEVQK